MGTTYSMNYINHNDAFLLAREISSAGNPYGLSTAADSHMMKDSEWGAVAYLSKSQYGLGKTDIFINNISLNGGGKERTSNEGKTGVESVYAMTGLTINDEQEKSKVISGTKEIVDKINKVTGNTPTTEKIYTWEQATGIKASTTGTIYGIYDLSGGLWERTAAYVANDNDNLNKYGASLTDSKKAVKGTKYTMVYEKGSSDIDTENYNANKDVYGNAMAETSTSGTGLTSWYSDYSYFVSATRSVFSS